VIGQTKVVVGTDHDHPFSVDHDLGILGGFEFAKEKVVATVIDLSNLFINLHTFFKDIHNPPFLTPHPIPLPAACLPVGRGRGMGGML